MTVECLSKEGQEMLRLTSITIGAPAPRDLARFYARLLGSVISSEEASRAGEPEEAGWAQVRTNGGLTLNFEYEAQWRAPVWPSEPDQQHITQHLDIAVDDLDAAIAWAEACGAVQDHFQPQAGVRVMRDPAGHPFCLFIDGE